MSNIHHMDAQVCEYADEDAITAGLLVPVVNLGLHVSNHPVDRVSIFLWSFLTSGIPRNEDGSLPTAALEAAVCSVCAGFVQSDPFLFKSTVFNPETGDQIIGVLNERNRITLLFKSEL